MVEEKDMSPEFQVKECQKCGEEMKIPFKDFKNNMIICETCFRKSLPAPVGKVNET